MCHTLPYKDEKLELTHYLKLHNFFSKPVCEIVHFLKGPGEKSHFIKLISHHVQWAIHSPVSLSLSAKHIQGNMYQNKVGRGRKMDS